MSVSATQSSTSATTATSNGIGAVSETQDRFLKLLIAQLQNQDPMNPMDNAQMTTQLAQMSTVEGINKMNDSFAELMSSMQATQGLQAASMIGRFVMVEGDTMASDGSGGLAGVDLGGSVDKLVVTVKNADGEVVQSMDMGPHQAGFVRFGWDGLDNNGNPTPAGTYTFSVAASAAGKAVEATTYATGQVGGVYLSDSGVQLDVGGMGSYSFSEVKQIL